MDQPVIVSAVRTPVGTFGGSLRDVPVEEQIGLRQSNYIVEPGAAPAPGAEQSPATAPGPAASGAADQDAGSPAESR